MKKQTFNNLLAVAVLINIIWAVYLQNFYASLGWFAAFSLSIYVIINEIDD